MDEDTKAKLIIGVQLAIAAGYIFWAIKTEAEAPLKAKVKTQKKLLKKAQKHAFKEIKRETKAIKKQRKNIALFR